MTSAGDFRWGDYFMRRGDEFGPFWQELTASWDRDILFIVGHGFDRRMCLGIREVLAVGGGGSRDVILIEYDEGPKSHSQKYKELREENGHLVEELLSSRGTISRRPIRMFSLDGRRIGARSIANKFQSLDDFSLYSDVIVDISALPRGLYFPLLSKLLALFDHDPGDRSPNLHVTVAHSPSLDKSIVDEDVEETASFLHGFSAASFEREATKEQPRIWIPLLGRGQSVQLERAYELVNPNEICPLLPSPARNPREADDLVLEYRELLFDQLRVEPQNIIYASEANPFEVYRQLMRSMVGYQQALRPLGGCKVVLSAMSSKLLSVGALLSAYELSQWRKGRDRIDVGVAHVDAQGYRIAEMGQEDSATELFSLWLCGECYEAA